MTHLRRINPSVPVVAMLMALTAVLRLVNLTGSPIRLDDEGTYVAQAFAVSQWSELAHYTYWYDHPPAGWLQLALWQVITGPGFAENAVAAGRYLMVVVSVVTAALLWSLARRIGLSRWTAAFAVVILAVSPLAVSLGRSVYLDNLAVAWLLAALVLVCSPRHRLSAMFGAAVCFGVAVLTKETMLLFVPLVAWLVWSKTAPATRRYAMAVFVAVSGLVVSTYLLMASVRGELIPGPGHVSLWEGIRFQLWQREAGGSLGDAGSLKRHTIDEWLRLDPVLPLLAGPAALAGLLVARLRPYAVGLLVLVVTVVRPGYLPVPFVIAALPFIALLIAGLGEAVVMRYRRAAPTRFARRARYGSLLTAAFAAALVVTLWLPGHRTVLTTDEDGALRQAQEWVADNVPKDNRLIVDDALWVDLVRDGRDRHNVVWSYKVDTDEQVKTWAPEGWADYEWVVSTPSMRANMPAQGVLTDAMAHSTAVATFGSAGNRIDVLRVDPAGSAAKPAAPSFGVQVASRLDPASDSGAVADLQTGTVDQRVVASLALMSAMQPVRLSGISGVAAEDAAGTPRRQFTLSGPADVLRPLAAFMQQQRSPFDTESVTLRGATLTVRFPAQATDIGLADDPGPLPDGAAQLRVADLRRETSHERVQLLRMDGTSVGSLPLGGGPNPSDYRTTPAGTYVMTTTSERDGMPTLRQAFTLKPGASYTLALFSAPENGEIAAQLAPDGSPGASVRLVNAASATGPVTLSLDPPGSAPTVLAQHASYGLVTGYGTQPAGVYDAIVNAGGREWRTPVELRDGSPSSLILTDGPDGPALRQVSDVPGPPIALDAGATTLPAAQPAPNKTAAQPPTAHDPRPQVIPVVLSLAVLAGLGLWARTLRRRQRQ